MSENSQLSRTDISELFDIYGGLLTEKQQDIFRLYFYEDLSLSEIAEEQGVSRAAVHDALKKSERALKEYEGIMGVRKKKLIAEKALTKVMAKVEADGREDISKSLRKIMDNL